MKSNQQLKISDNLAIVLVGDPKVGKSRLIAGFPTPYILDLDKNLASVQAVIGDKPFFYDQADKDEKDQPVALGDQWPQALKYLETACRDPKIETICIDSLTRAGELVEAHIIHRLKQMGVKLRPDTVDEQIRLADYDTYATLLLKAVALTRSSGKIVVWTSHQTAREDPLTGAVKMRYSIAGKLKETFGGYFTDVWGMQADTKLVMVGGKAVETTTYSIRTRPATGNKFVPLGTSVPTLEAEIDITNKNPKELWPLLAPKLSINIKPALVT